MRYIFIVVCVCLGLSSRVSGVLYDVEFHVVVNGCYICEEGAIPQTYTVQVPLGTGLVESLTPKVAAIISDDFDPLSIAGVKLMVAEEGTLHNESVLSNKLLTNTLLEKVEHMGTHVLIFECTANVNSARLAVERGAKVLQRMLPVMIEAGRVLGGLTGKDSGQIDNLVVMQALASYHANNTVPHPPKRRAQRAHKELLQGERRRSTSGEKEVFHEPFEKDL